MIELLIVVIVLAIAFLIFSGVMLWAIAVSHNPFRKRRRR